MFYKVKLSDHIRIPPEFFGTDLSSSVLQMLKKKYEGYISKELGIVIDVADLGTIDKGIIIQGDGAAYYKVLFELLTFKPELQEVVIGKIKDIADFGAFISIGPIDGMIHISQTMEDYVSLSKTGTLSGKASKRNLAKGDDCLARVVAISYKSGEPKIGLTMRQPGLGKLEWLKEDKKKKESAAKVAAKKATKSEKGGKK